MKRVGIYARYSSDNQREASIEDQLRICRERVGKEDNWTVINNYTDYAISGASLMRPGIQALISDALSGKLDIILAEDLDRLSRDMEDIAGIYKRMEFSDVEIITLSDGKITDLHIGLKGTMSARFLKDLAMKTHRGLQGRIEAGKSGGGKSYGYDVLHTTNSKGEIERGDRQINADHALIIKRIFEDYVAGKSPRAIAIQLNKENIAGPTGKTWGPSTINGNRERGTGILNNELYIGRLVWNRLNYRKNPDTGKRVSRLNPESEWTIKQVPELRIIEQELWDAVKAKQGAIKKLGKKFWQKQRPRNLFSYLLKCSECDGGYSKVSQMQYGCSNASKKGSCDNHLTISQNKLEHAVLDALQTHLMTDERCEIFCKEYTAHMNRLRSEQNASLDRHKRELNKIHKQRDRIIQAVKDGFASPELKVELDQLIERRTMLESIIDNTEVAPTLFHPSMAKMYQRQVNNLVQSLNDETQRQEAAEIIRKLVDKIILKPNETKDGLLIDLHGDLAGILGLAAGHKEKATPKGGFISSAAFPQDKMVAGVRDNLILLQSQDKMVAGVGFEPTTFRL